MAAGGAAGGTILWDCWGWGTADLLWDLRRVILCACESLSPLTCKIRKDICSVQASRPESSRGPQLA